jgi:signal transduction histidine kinase
LTASPAARRRPTTLARLDQRAFARIVQIAPESFHGNFLRCVVERLRSVNSNFITELTRNERLSTVGSMANSVIHDLRNPIQIIRSCAEFVAARTDDEQICEFMRLQTRAVAQMTDMIQELLDFARGESSVHLERARAAAVFEELYGQLVRIIPDNIHLVKETDCNAELDVDVGRFARLLMNLVKNAIEAMPGGGILSISVRRDGESVIYKVADTGCGIPEDLQPRIFEPFVTHGKSKGTGLGLAIAKSVAQAHRGTITLNSKPGVGTTFEIRVPAA